VDAKKKRKTEEGHHRRPAGCAKSGAKPLAGIKGLGPQPWAGPKKVEEKNFKVKQIQEGVCEGGGG